MQLDFEEIKKLIPQRFPFIMIDRVLEIEPGKHATAVKNISGNDMVFLGHFTGKGNHARRSHHRSYGADSHHSLYHRQEKPGTAKQSRCIFLVRSRHDFSIRLCRVTS